jgi:hypothetical protein
MAASENAQPNPLTLHRYQHTNKRHTEDLGDEVTLPVMLTAREFWMGQTEVDTPVLQRQVRANKIEIKESGCDFYGN